MQNVQHVLDRIPPEAWPLIDTAFRITAVLAGIWLLLAIVAAWRRRAYNLTVASTASRSDSAQPDFLKVNEKAREAAIARGEAHEEFLEKREREEAAAALALSKGPLTWAQRLAKLSAFLMSIFTFATVAFGAITNVSRMGESLQSVGSVEKVKMVIANNWFGALVAAFVIGWHVYKYFADKKYKEG